jgi:hypothetical protein
MLLSIPMANQTLFLAGCSELDELQERQSQCSAQKQVSRSSRHLLLDAIEGYSRFANVLERMSSYWDGIRWIYGVLMQRKAGFMADKLTDLDVGTDTMASKQELVRTVVEVFFALILKPLSSARGCCRDSMAAI